MSTKRSRNNQHEPHVGAHHRVYGRLSHDITKNITYTFSWIEGARLDSLIEIYLRDGNSLHDMDSLASTYETPELAEVRRRLIDDFDKFKNKSHNQFVYNLSIIECFYLELLPLSDFSKYLILLRSRLIPIEDELFSGNSVRNRITFCPLKEIELVAFIQYLITPKESTTAFGIYGRGVGYKSLEGFITVVRTIHRAAGIPEGLCPTHGENVKAIKKDVFDRYHPEGALTLDCATFIPDAYVAVFSSDIPHLDKLMRWAMLLISINIFARASEMTEYCPLAEDMTFPTDAEDWCADGFPRYIKITLKWWKSKKKLQPVEYIIWRNFLNSMYCPMTNLLLWLRVSGIRKGPIFVKLRGGFYRRLCYRAEHSITKRRGSVNYTVWVDNDSNEVNLSYENWREICKMFFDRAGVSGATTHSIRKSAAVWAARCGAEEYQIREAGRWNTGDTYMVYVKSGKSIASLAATRSDGSVDPIRRVWVFHPTVFLATMKNNNY